ncbi:choline-sulfatase [Roseovarius faecimaris]|uniref:Choline-sulfatase n=1 Tax=Roseovarius faecimaris TaxID=2494550 RepID=A0A6I6ISY6_9RHOB|nr:sulfatase-like hydrolase/transferase [Roseovarius faecimaris]QGX98426.1 choline-sulfatase [Roseovarius faecimaris]
MTNLLILISDEHRRDAMGCAGHKLVKTPNLDALAARGALFENAYTPCPMCVPTRAALACGDYVHRTGYWDSATPYDGTQRSWMHELREAGRDVVSIGKLHFRSGEDDNGFSEEILPMHVVGGVGWAIGLLREEPPDYDAAAELAGDVGRGASSYTDYDLMITQAAEAWLGDRARKQRPWAAFVSLVSPHYPLKAPQDWYDLYDPETVDLPVGYAAEADHPELRHLRRFFKYQEYFDAQRMREARAAYYGLTSFMDDCLGRVLHALEDSGQAEDTLILYVSDHGEMLGDHGYWTKQVMYEASAGVPMILAGPGVPPRRRVRSGASLLDIAATAREVAGLPARAERPGQSLRALAQAPDDPDRTVFSEYHDGGSSTGTFMIRWDRWKYVHYVGYAPQLFDLETDPQEFQDLAPRAAREPHIAAILAEGRARLQRICDPDVVNARCFADQKARIEELGGVDACRNAYVFNHTPAPGETEEGAPL